MDVLDEIDQRVLTKPLVNESSVDPLDEIDARVLGVEDARKGIKSPQQIDAEEKARQHQANLPKTWFGEVKQGVARGVDQLQELGYGLGVLGAEAADLPKVRDWFVKAVEEQRSQIESQPATVPTYEGVDNFDSFMRYVLSGAGEFAPQVAESFAAGAIGAAVGTGAAPGPGTAIGGLTGFVEKQAIKNILKSKVDQYLKDELIDVAKGKIGKTAGRAGMQRTVTPEAHTLLVNETKNLMGKYGSWAGVGTSSWGMETASIYNDLKEDPNLQESDRRASAIVGGLIAAIPDTVLGGYIASKFFPGVKNVPTKEIVEANNYLVKFAKNFATQIPKYATLEGGQEYAQTIVEEAAKNYADPAKREAIFTFTPEQKVSFLDAAFKGAIGGGLMGGGAASVKTFHNNPKVRERERVIIQKMANIDPTVLDAPEEPEDQRLSVIANRKDEIEKSIASGTLKPEEFEKLNTEKTALEAEESTILGEETIIEQPQPKAQPVRISPLEKSVSTLRALYPDQKRTAEVSAKKAPKEELARVDTEIESLVNEIANAEPEQNKSYGDAIREAITPDMRNFFASEGVMVRLATPEEIKNKLGGGETFAVMDVKNQKFAMVVPTAKEFFTNADALATTASESPKAATDYLANIKTIVGHEAIHIADYVQIRNQWKAEGSGLSFGKYEQRLMKARGVALRKAGKYLPSQVKSVYNYANLGTVDDRTLGQEFTRMLVEYARTGKLTEVTEALAKADREAQDPEAKGAISEFLNKWIEAIRNIHASLAKFLDPEQAPAELVMAFDQINKVLDKYGVLVNEKIKAKKEAKTKKETKAKAEKKEKPGQKGKKAAKSSNPAEAIAAGMGVKFDGVFMGRRWQFTNQNEDQPTFGRTFTTAIGANEEEVAEALQAVNDAEANAEVVDLDTLLGGLGFPPKEEGTTEAAEEAPSDKKEEEVKSEAKVEEEPPVAEESPLVNESQAAKAPTPNKKEIAKVNRMLRDSAKMSKSLAGGMRLTESENLPVQGDVLYEGAEPRQLEYATRPRAAGLNEAVEAIAANGGALEVAEKLLEDPIGKFLELTEDAGTQIGPNAKLGWVYDDVTRQLYDVAKKLQSGDGSRAMISKLRTIANQIKDRIMLTRNTAGALIDSSGKILENMDGAATLEQLRSQIIPHADRAIGADSRKKIKDLTDKLNETLVNESPKAVKSAKFISAVRRLMKLVTKGRWEKGYRKTIIENVKILQDITKKAAARMAQFTGLDKDANAYTEEYITRLVKEMSGLPKSARSKQEVQVVREALGSVLRHVGKSMGFITDSAKVDKMSMQQKMAIVLKNETLYGEFAALLKNAYIKEYGGGNPSPEFMVEAETVYQNVASRMYDTESLNALVNEKLREYNVTIADIAKKGYIDGEANVELIRRDLKAFMDTQGVNNKGLVDALVEDLTEAMEERIEKARAKFLGSTATIKDSLSWFGTNLTEAVTDYSVNPDKMMESFQDYLTRRHGFPNTKDLPMASYFAKVMMDSLSPLVANQNARLLQQWLNRAEKEVENSSKTALEKDNSKRKLKVMVDKVLALSKAGVMEQEDIYNVLQPLFDLPKWNPEVAREIMELGDKMELAKSERQKNTVKGELADLLAQHKPLSTVDAYTSWMYVSMLSGPGTPAVNLAGNFLGLMSYVTTEAAKRPYRLPQMLRALIRAGIGSGYAEMRESWFWGTALGKDGNKYFKGKNISEMSDPFFDGRFSERLGLKKADEATAQFTHWLLRKTRAKYIGRMLTATDMWFYKMAQEMAFAARSNTVGTPQMWESAIVQARSEMIDQGLNPDENKANRARRDVLAHSIYETLRLEQGDKALVNENTIAWLESHQEALEATFQQEPTGLLGWIARKIEEVTTEYPAGKLIIPFTRVAANITNFMLDWTPVGAARYMIGNLNDKTNPFKLMEDGKYNPHIDHFTRSVLGMASTMVLMMMAGLEADEDDPDFMIYGDGPKDLDLKRMMMNRGWKANSIKIGGTYYSYIYWPNAMALSIIGRQFDNYREGRIASPYDFSMATTAVALVEAVKNQSFLVSIADLFGAIDSSNPERNLSRLGARIVTIPIPNILKQADKFLDPTIQQAEAFHEYLMKEAPFFRWGLEPALNYFGEPIERTKGAVPLPGFDRFATFEKTDDPVLNLISERNFKLPGYSKSTRLHGQPIGEKYGEYIKLAGPRIYKRIEASIHTLREMKKQDAQEALEDIATEEKKKARLELEQKYQPSR